MLKSEMQHQFWITKKTVQRKFGSKEDENIIASDAELDSKIEVFKSISETSTDLSKIIDQYQERLCIISQEECIFGRFLKEIGKRSKTTGHSISNTGKAVSYSGQQRMCVRIPLLRLHHEVEVFRCRAVSDTQVTINAMEKERTEYRAALSWMKSSSSVLDPDTGKGLDKFRMAQSHVRNAKQTFDGISLDTIQKIDLLSAARCNMYSQALISYMSELYQFAKKTENTFQAISKVLLKNPRYDFFVLKDLSQNEDNNFEFKQIETIDKDQSLFFLDEYCDEVSKRSSKQNVAKPIMEKLFDQSEQKITKELSSPHSILENNSESTSSWSHFFNTAESPKLLTNLSPSATSNETIKTEDKSSHKNQNLKSIKSKKMHAWMDFFAELDPLANPEDFDLKISGGKQNYQQT